MLSEIALFQCQVTAPSAKDYELTLAWNYARFGVEWPVESPSLAPRDVVAPRSETIPTDRPPR